MRGDKIRIDYGYLNKNRSIVELKVLDSYETGGELKIECKDTGSGEKVIAYLKEDIINSGKPILELRIKSSQQTFQFLYN